MAFEDTGARPWDAWKHPNKAKSVSARPDAFQASTGLADALGWMSLRTNVEDDLWISGRLPKLARTLQIREALALGLLVCVYRRTQHAEIVEASIDRIMTIVVVDFDTDDEARHFLFAMVSSKLATMSDDGSSMTIHGNEPHVDRLTRLRGQAGAGGKARQKSRLVSEPTAKLQLSHSLASRSAPSSLLPVSVPSLSVSDYETAPDTPRPEPAVVVVQEPRGAPIPIPPQTDDLATIVASQIPAADAMRLWAKHQAETERRKLARLPMPVGMDLHHCRTILALAGRHMPLAEKVLEAYVRCNSNPYWSDKKWPLWALARERDFQEALTMARASGYAEATAG